MPNATRHPQRRGDPRRARRALGMTSRVGDDGRKRPFIFTNMAMSLDGKIATYERGAIALGTPYDREVMDQLRSLSDLVLIGSGTLRASGQPMRVRSKALIEVRIKGGLSPQPISGVASSTLDLPMDSAFMKAEGLERWIFTTQSAILPSPQPSPACGRGSKTLSYNSGFIGAPGAESGKLAHQGGDLLNVIPCGAEVTPEKIITYCQKKGLKRILIEGGGALTFSFLKEGLIDELYVTLTPKLVGGATAPTLCDGQGFRLNEIVTLEPQSCERIGDEFYLHYRVKK